MFFCIHFLLLSLKRFVHGGLAFEELNFLYPTSCSLVERAVNIARFKCLTVQECVNEAWTAVCVSGALHAVVLQFVRSVVFEMRPIAPLGTKRGCAKMRQFT